MRFSRQVMITIAASALLASLVSFAAPSALAAWTASANATFTQSSKTVPSATFNSCKTDLANNSALLTWPAAAATQGGSAFKQYFLEWYYGTPAAPGALILTTTRTDPYAQPTSTQLTGNSFVRVTYQYQTGWNSLAPATYAFTRSTDADRSPVCSPEK